MGIRDQRNQVYQNSINNKKTGEAKTASPESVGTTSLREQRLALYNSQKGTNYKKASTFTPKTTKTESVTDKARKKKLDNYIREFQAGGVDVDNAKKMAEGRLSVETSKQNKKATEQYEKELQELQSKDYNDNFLGQFKANYTLGDLTESANLATAEYLSNPTEENKLKAERAKALKDAFTKNSSAAGALDDENTKAEWLTKDLAAYLPQFKNQQVAGLKGAVPGAAAGAATGFALGNLTGVGAVLPEELLTVPGGALKGGKLGYTAGTTKYSYDTMRGAAYQQLIEAGVPEDIATKAASDEGVVSAMIEAGSTLLGLKFLGFDKLGKTVIGTAGKEAAKNTATKTVLKALAGYGLNIPQEYLEEGSQEVVSIANEERIKNGGDTGLLNLVGESISKATNLSEAEKEQVKEAGEAGAKIAMMMGAAGAATSNTLNYAVTKAQDASVGSSIKASDMTNAVVNDALASDDVKTKAKAEQVVKDLSSGKDVSNSQLGSLYKSVAKEQTAKAEAQAKATAEVQESSVVKSASTSDNTLSKVFAQKQVENPTAKVTTPTTETLMAQGVATEKAVKVGDAITVAVEGGEITNGQVDTILSSSSAKAEFEAQTGVKLASEKSKARKQIKEYATQVAQQKVAKAEATQAQVQMVAEQNIQQAKAQAEAQMQMMTAQQEMTATPQMNKMEYTEFAKQMRVANPQATDMQIASAYQDYMDSDSVEVGSSSGIDEQGLKDFVERVSAQHPDMTPQEVAEAYQAYKASEAPRSSIKDTDTGATPVAKNADVEYVAKRATSVFQKYGIEVKTYENPSNKKQKGYYSPKDKVIYLNASALKGRNDAAYTLAHELMHPAIAKDQTLAKDFLEVCKKEGIITEEQITAKINKARPLYEAQARDMGETDLSFITDDYLKVEVSCDLASEVFGDVGLLERVVKQDLKFFARLMASIKQVISGTKGSALKKDYQEIFNRMDKVLKADEDNLMTKAEDGRPNFHIETYELGGKELLNKWLDTQSDLDKQTKDDIREGMNKAYELATSLKGKYESYDAWNEATVIERDGKPVMSVIVKNGEYTLNIDFSTICKKRKALDKVLNALVRTDGTAIARATQEDIAEINAIIKEHEFEIACGLCFVDAKRYRIADWASSFTDLWNELAKSAVEGTETELSTLKLLSKEKGAEGVGQDLKAIREKVETDTEVVDAEFNWTVIDEKIADDSTKPLQRKMAEHMRKHPEAIKRIEPQDLMASEGLDVLKATYPDIYTLLNAHQGSAKPKLSHSETPYNYEVLQSAKMTKEEAKSVGGVRIQSFSDYVANMFFDYVQLIGDLSAKELPAQAYTKEADFVKLFGMSGIKINMSLVPGVREISDADKAYLKSLINEKGEIPAAKKKQKRFQALAKNAGLDENGNYIWAKESFGKNGGDAGFQLAIELQKKDGYRENIGTIAVGVSDEHITKLLNDPDIRMVIPYHKSGINPAVALANNVVMFKDYTLYQNTRVAQGNKKSGVSVKFNSEGLAYTGDDKSKVLKTKDGRTIPHFDFYKDLEKSGDAKKTAQNYLDYCDDYHLIPKFDAFRDNPNYYKLLIDFNTYDAVTEEYTPQRAVTLKLPDDFSKIVEDSLQDSQETADRFAEEQSAVLDEVREKVLSKYKDTEDRELFSLSEEDFDLGEREEFTDLVPWGDKNVYQERTSARTSINSTKLPRLFGNKKFLDRVRAKIKEQGSVVIADLGGGSFDNAKQYFESIEFLNGEKFDASKYKESYDERTGLSTYYHKDPEDRVQFYVYDRFNRTEDHNEEVVRNIREGKADFVTINNVTNVIEERKSRGQLYLNAANAVKDTGAVYIAPYVGQKDGVVRVTQGGGSIQLNRTAKMYKRETERFFNTVTVSSETLVATDPIRKASDIRFSLSEEDAAKVDAFMERYNSLKKENKSLEAKVARAEDAKLNEMVKRILAEDKHKEELKTTKEVLNKTFKAKEAHNAKKAELDKTFAVDSVTLGKDIGYKRELRDTKRQYQAKIAESNRKAREDKLQAIAAQREEMWARVEVEKDKKADSDVAHLIHEKKAVAKEKQKSAEKLQGAKIKLSETRRLRSVRGKKARNTLRRHQNKTNEVLEQSVENTYKQITGKDLETAPKNVKTVWEGAKAASTSKAREARAVLVRGTQELDVFDRVQKAVGDTDIESVVTAVKMVRAAGNTCEYIYDTALVNAKGDVIGKALKDVALCYDEKGKFSQKDQNIFQMYLLAKHTVDRMSFKERAEQRVADFEASHPGLAEMSPEEFALLATQPKNSEGQYAYSREVADEYIRLMEQAQKAKNKPVLKADDGTAVRADTAEKIAESLEAENAWLKDKAQELYDWYDTFMQEWVVGTRLSQEQYDVLKEIYPHYVPTYRVKDYESGKVSFAGKQGVSVADVMKRAKGGLSEVMPIEDSFYNLINGYVKQHRDAELRNAMYASMEAHPDEFAGLGAIDSEVETEENLAEVDTTLEAPTLEEVKLEEVKDSAYRVSTWQNGEKKSMWVSKEVYDSLRSLDGSAGLLTDEFKEKTKLVRGYVSLRKTLITGINPFFGIRNMVRDLQSALVYTEGSPLHFSNAWFRAWREMASKSENWQHFIALGGLYSTRTRVDGGFAKAFGKGDSTGVKVAKKVPAAMGKFNEASEAVTRFAEYLSTIDRLGDSYEARLQAIRNASEITLDFGEAGRWGRDINQYVMYWNAQMQGVDKFVREVRNKPAKTLSRAAVLMSVPTIMCYALASFMDKEDEWDNIPSYVHDDYWVVFVGNEGDYIKVPKTREFGAIISMPLTRLLLSKDGVPDAWDNWSGTLKANFLADEPVGNLPIISTVNDIRANKNYRDVPIVSSKFSNITAKEDFEKVYDENTSVIAVKLGELFNVKPILIDYVLKTEFGSMMSMALDAMAVGGTHNKSLLDTVKYTGEAAVGKLGIGNSTGYSRNISRFYDLASETESNKTAIAFDVTEEDALHATPEWQINNVMSKYRTEMSELNKAKRELISQTMSKTERDTATAELNAQIEALAVEALDLYDDFKAGKIKRPDLVYKYRKDGIQEDVMNALIALDGYAEEEDVDFKLSTLNAKSVAASEMTSRVTYDIQEHQGEYNRIFTSTYNESLSKAISSSEYRTATDAEKAKMLTEAKSLAKADATTAMAEYMKANGVKPHIKSGIEIDATLEEELIKVSKAYKSSRAYFPRESAPTTIAHLSSKYSKTYEMVLTEEEQEEYMKIYESTYNKYMAQAVNSSRYQAMSTYNDRRDYLYKVKGDIDDAVKEHYIKTLEGRGRKYSKKQQ